MLNKKLEKYWETIVMYMDDDKQEQVHFELAPCEPDKFLRRYLELDPDFAVLLQSEFSIDVDDLTA